MLVQLGDDVSKKSQCCCTVCQNSWNVSWSELTVIYCIITISVAKNGFHELSK